MAPRKRPPRRKPGTGAIRYKAGRDQPWEAAFPLGHGRFRYDSFQSRPEAEAHLDALTAERDDKDQPRNVVAGSQRFDAFIQAWLGVKAPHVAAKTLYGYRYYCELASGQWASRRIDTIRREDANDLLGYFHKAGFKNVAQLRGTLRQAFEYALQEDYIKRNPFQHVKAPSVDRAPRVVLTAEQRSRMLACAARDDDPRIPLQPLWHLYSRLGFRRGEGLALLWADIDLESGTITLSRSATTAGRQRVTGKTKTRRSRVSALPADLIVLLRTHKANQIRDAARNPDWQQRGFVFCDANGNQVDYWHVDGRWEKLRARAELPAGATIHGLRHTAAFLLEQQGVPRSTRMALLGHTTVEMSDHYSDHASVEDIRRALEGQ